VYLAARSEEKVKASLKRIEDEGHEKGSAEWLHLDLSDPALAKKAAEDFLTKEQRQDILINNAAVIIADYKMGSRGIQEIITVNHFSPFIFTSTLLPLMKSTATLPGSDVRIVNVASGAHTFVNPTQFKTKEDFNTSYEGTRFSTMKRYGLSKLCNILWTKELQSRLTEEGCKITCISLHPGTVFTESSISTAQRFPAFMRPILLSLSRMAMMDTTQGAGTPLLAATSPEALKSPEKYQGAYLEPMGKISKVSKTAANVALAQELWTTTETMLKEMEI